MSKLRLIARAFSKLGLMRRIIITMMIVRSGCHWFWSDEVSKASIFDVWAGFVVVYVVIVLACLSRADMRH